MAVKRFIMRLYRIHDLDLLYLYKNPNFNFHKFLYRCLENFFLEDKPFVASLPPGRDDIAEPKLVTPISVSIKNDIIIEGLSKIDEGKRNIFIKTLMRCYIEFPNFSYFSINYNLDKFGLSPGRQIESFINTKRGYNKKEKKKINSFKDIENMQENAEKSIEKISSETISKPLQTKAVNKPKQSLFETDNNDTEQQQRAENVNFIDENTINGLAAFSDMFNNF